MVRSTPGSAPPEADTASTTREPCGSRMTPGERTFPATWTTTVGAGEAEGVPDVTAGVRAWGANDAAVTSGRATSRGAGRSRRTMPSAPRTATRRRTATTTTWPRRRLHAAVARSPTAVRPLRSPGGSGPVDPPGVPADPPSGRLVDPPSGSAPSPVAPVPRRGTQPPTRSRGRGNARTRRTATATSSGRATCLGRTMPTTLWTWRRPLALRRQPCGPRGRFASCGQRARATRGTPTQSDG